MIGFGISGIIGLVIGFLVGRLRAKRSPVPAVPVESPPDFKVEDVICLANTNDAADVNALFLKYKVNVCMPEFYEKYQRLTKHSRDSYYAELLDLLGRKKQDCISGYEDWPSFSPQEQLLLLMYGMKLDNKTIARLLGISSDTLKKRRNRLKLKVNITGLNAEEKEDGESPSPPAPE